MQKAVILNREVRVRFNEKRFNQRLEGDQGVAVWAIEEELPGKVNS